MPERLCLDCQTDISSRSHLAKRCVDCNALHRRIYLTEYAKKGGNRGVPKEGYVEPPPQTELRTTSQCQLEGCTNRIGIARARNNAKYCTHQHTMKAASRRSEERKKAARKAQMVAEGVTDAPTARRGDAYQTMMDPENFHLTKLLMEGKLDANYLANVLGYSKSAILRALQAVRTTVKIEELKEDWEPTWKVKAMLPKWKLDRIRELGVAGEHTDEFQRLATEIVHAYQIFSRYYFTLEGNRPEVEPFHLEWIRSIVVAYAVGGKQLILSPPRHGKSEMLIRFCVWFIVMEPNIRIMWIAANKDVASLMLGAAKDHLTNNEKLIRDTLPPGDQYKPSRQESKPWSAKEFKIRQQSHVGQKSSSMLCLGRTSKILSRDVDVLIVDDLEDFDTTREPSQRLYSRNKFAEIGTRKEERTAWVNICSRQHPDDVAARLMKLEGADLAWRIIVNTAHQECDLDPDVILGHDANGCVLFPDVRSYRWLMEKKFEMDALGIPGAYEMRYLNKPIPEEGIVFNIPLIRERALDKSRDIGIEGLPAGRMVAGLDPAARGTQAGFLWHYANDTLSMVDLEAQKAGGFAGAHYLMEDWENRYGLKDWFYEDNSQQVEFFNDPRTKALARRLGLNIKVHTTGKNKQDAELGISSMAPWYHDGNINLPYGTAEARKKVNMLLNQLELWTTDGVKTGKHAKTDIKMASWFPFPTIIKWGKADRNIGLHVQGEPSYPNISGFGQLPWGNTGYFGR